MRYLGDTTRGWGRAKIMSGMGNCKSGSVRLSDCFHMSAANMSQACIKKAHTELRLYLSNFFFTSQHNSQTVHDTDSVELTPVEIQAQFRGRTCRHKYAADMNDPEAPSSGDNVLNASKLQMKTQMCEHSPVTLSTTNPCTEILYSAKSHFLCCIRSGEIYIVALGCAATECVKPTCSKQQRACTPPGPTSDPRETGQN